MLQTKMTKSIVILLVAVVGLSQGIELTKCQLVRELRRLGFPENKLRDWVCLVEAESGRMTDKVSGLNHNGSRDHGLFQINDKYWCSRTNNPGKDCHVTCADVTKDDITKAAACAKKIYQRHKFQAWYGWRKHCHGRALPNIKGC